MWKTETRAQHMDPLALEGPQCDPTPTPTPTHLRVLRQLAQRLIVARRGGGGVLPQPVELGDLPVKQRVIGWGGGGRGDWVH